MGIRFPTKKPRGGQRTGADEKHIASLRVFAEDIKEVRKGMDFPLSARGWCYIMEQYGLKKGDFKKYGEKWIRECRVYGFFEPGFILEDESHTVEQQPDKRELVEDFVEYKYDTWQTAGEDFKDSWEFYNGLSFWEGQDYYIQLLVEKVDLKSLFRKICNKYRIPVANLHGFGSLEQKAVMARNFQLAEREGKKTILLACTDHDPPGIIISNLLKGDFEELRIFTGWNPKNLKVERIGLSYTFIQANHLKWVNNLKTASDNDLSKPSHQHYKTYDVANYIKKYGKRKCEANAIVVVPELGRKMLQDYIDKWLGKNAYEDYMGYLEIERERAKRLINDRLGEE